MTTEGWLTALPPGWILMLGALVLPLLPRGLARVWMLALPAAGLVQLGLAFEAGTSIDASIFGYALTPVRSDAMARLWGIIFHIAALLSALYSLEVRDRVQQMASLAYAGSAIAAVFAGDLLTLFVYWELTAVTSVFLVWARGSERAYRAGMRYLIVQVGSGVLLLVGVVWRSRGPHGLEFGPLGPLDEPAALLVFLAFGIKAAFPFLHGWLKDAYPEATASGTVWLGSFTTKLAIYALARGFAGEPLLVPIGATMAVFPLFLGAIENDLRRVLAYSLNNQLGFMVVGIGIGTAASLNGTAAHAFSHILYKALLFMAMGAVLQRTGTCKASELGGLVRSMPWTCAFCIVGAATTVALPLSSGFVTKSIILSEVSHGHWTITLLALLFASGGAILVPGIKVPYFAFFGRDAGLRVEEAPRPMLLAMGATALGCVGIGVFPGLLYRLLPFPPVAYQPYTLAHVVQQLQLLAFGGLAIALLVAWRVYPRERPSTSLDVDWLYRKAAPALLLAVGRRLEALQALLERQGVRRVEGLIGRVHRHHGPRGVMARTWPTGSMALWVAAALTGVLVMYFS